MRPDPGSGLGRVARRLVAGTPVLRLEVRDADGRWELLVPDHPQLAPGRVAAAVAVHAGLRARFGRLLAIGLHVERNHEVSPRRKPLAGYASDGRAHLLPAQFLAGPDEPPPRPLAPGRLRRPPEPGEVVAHEDWHVVEAALGAVDRRAAFELRRRAGEFLGVRTIEHVYGPTPHATPAQQDTARALLHAAGGAYALTNAMEGTAVLFERWWCGTVDHPVVTAFGALVDELVPRR